MNWEDEKKFLEEQLEILLELKRRFGPEVVKLAHKMRLEVHKQRMKKLREKSSRLKDVFLHSAFSVSVAEPGILEYEVLEDSERKFAVRVTRCAYAEFYTKRGFPDIGYALHCAMDFEEAKAFWPEIDLIRTQTLMQGADFCDHCYHLTETNE
jgi:hypothetical protein